MKKWKWFGSLSLFVAGCSGQTGVLVDIGSWPAGAESLEVAGMLDGAPSSETLSFKNGTTRFVVYLQDRQRGRLALTLTAIDQFHCPRATAATEIEVGGGLRRIAETAVELTPLTAPYCPAPQLEGLSPALAPTSGALGLSVSGKNFLQGAKLYIDGVMAGEPQVVSPIALTAIVPERLGAFGSVLVELRNPDGQVASRGDLFSYYASVFGYASQTSFGAGATPRATAAGDFNKDGKLDIAVANGGSTLSLLLGDGKGGFAPATNFPTGGNATFVSVADFNGDKNLDCAVVTFGDNSVSLLLGDGKGSFSPYTNLPGFSSPSGLALGDA